MPQRLRLVALAALLVIARHLSGCAKEASQCICVPDGHNEKGELELLCTGGDPSDPLAPCILKEEEEDTE